MKAQSNRATARLSKNGKYLIVEQDDQSAVINANLIRYLVDIPFIRKGGTPIGNDQIYRLKLKAQAAYDRKVKSSAS